HRRQRLRPGAAADREKRLLRDPFAVQGQGLARALRDPHPQAADRHPPAVAENRRLPPAPRLAAGRCGHRDPTLMAAILGKKPGMPQVFREDGTVVPVTVIAAGPCKVTAIRDAERDGYTAVQLAFDEVSEEKLTRAELGHLKKAGAPPMRHL